MKHEHPLIGPSLSTKGPASWLVSRALLCRHRFHLRRKRDSSRSVCAFFKGHAFAKLSVGYLSWRASADELRHGGVQLPEISRSRLASRDCGCRRKRQAERRCGISDVIFSGSATRDAREGCVANKSEGDAEHKVMLGRCCDIPRFAAGHGVTLIKLCEDGSQELYSASCGRSNRYRNLVRMILEPLSCCTQ